MLEIHSVILSNKCEVYLNIPLNMLPSKVKSSIFSPLTRWTWARLGRRVRSTEPRSPKSGSSTPPGSSQGWTTVTPAGWPMAAFGMQSPGHEETVVPLSQGCAALGSHLPTTSTESTATSQTMNERRAMKTTLISYEHKRDISTLYYYYCFFHVRYWIVLHLSLWFR